MSLYDTVHLKHGPFLWTQNKPQTQHYKRTALYFIFRGTVSTKNEYFLFDTFNQIGQDFGIATFVQKLPLNACANVSNMARGIPSSTFILYLSKKRRFWWDCIYICRLIWAFTESLLADVLSIWPKSCVLAEIYIWYQLSFICILMAQKKEIQIFSCKENL